MPTDRQVEAAAARLFAHAMFQGDDYTARSLARDMLREAEKAMSDTYSDRAGNIRRQGDGGIDDPAR